jgi:cellulose synthase/poly-beta-1,6-N-acetylglucosamine synthase-like glycosyltransferase
MGIKHAEKREIGMASHATVTHPSTTPKISVIIPVYNDEKYLPECLDSVVNQSDLARDRNYLRQ